LNAGAFSDAKVVKASERLVRVLVDVDKCEKVAQTYKVRSMPTILFLDSTGKQVDKLGGRDADSVVQQFNEIADKHSRGPKWGESVDKALEAGKKEKKPVVLLFTDEDPKSMLWARVTFCDASIKQELVDKCVFAKTLFKKDDAVCAKWNVKENRTVVLLDVTGEAPRELKRLSKSSKGSDAKSALDSAVKAMTPTAPTK